MLCCAGEWPVITMALAKVGALTQLTWFGATSQERLRERPRRRLLRRSRHHLARQHHLQHQDLSRLQGLAQRRCLGQHRHISLRRDPSYSVLARTPVVVAYLCLVRPSSC